MGEIGIKSVRPFVLDGYQIIPSYPLNRVNVGVDGFLPGVFFILIIGRVRRIIAGQGSLKKKLTYFFLWEWYGEWW